MPHIVVANIVKTFHIAEREPGTWGALKGVIQRRHRTISALDGVSFCIQPGELVGYIGPNGAGKSTTVKVLSGILVPDSGRCEIAGRVPWKERISHVRDIGVVFGQRTQLWWDLPVIESFDLLRDIYRIPGTEYISSRDELIGSWTPRCGNSPWARECAAIWPRRYSILPPPLPGRSHHWPGNRQCAHQRRDRNGPIPPGDLPPVVPPFLHLRRPSGRYRVLPRPGDPGPAGSARLLRMDAVPVPAGGSGISVHRPPRLETRRASLSVHGELTL